MSQGKYGTKVVFFFATSKKVAFVINFLGFSRKAVLEIVHVQPGLMSK